MQDKELPSRIGPVLLWSLSAAVLAYFLFSFAVLEATNRYSYQLFLDLRGRTMANPRWEPWWGSTLFFWACLYSAVIHGVLVGLITYVVISVRAQRKPRG
ncbi:hypothetical protein [Gimesia panareensis]|uniref:hypothetical protein n=1 Tax=Gimesia panareensis TaxID=2527978 RepID=UPI00118B28E7|nr:hypothetical protein [Gimesia panareensis]QDU50905.1 hypothetical protein Pan110_32660 [Gimesia panareensis]